MHKKLLTYLVLICLPVISFAQFPLRGDVFDFQVGDELQFRGESNYGGQPPVYTTYIVTAVNIAPGGNSVQYDYDFERLELNYSTYQWDIRTTGTGGWTHGNLSDTLYGDATSMNGGYGGRQTVDLDASYGGPVSYHAVQHEWAVGLGETYYSHFAPGDNVDDLWSLIYYKKGATTWGSQVIVGMEEGLADQFALYPNPNAGNFRVQLDEFSGKTIEWEILDVTGKRMLTGNNQTRVFSVEAPNLKSGLYLLQIQMDGGAKVSKTFIVRH